MRAPWDDAIVVVTGASSGIGLELARQMAPTARGLALVARREERLEELAKELKEARPTLEVYVRATDLTDLADAGAMLDDVTEALGPIDVLVNNAGFGDMSPFDRAEWDKLHRMIQLNVTALTYLSHRVYPGMVERKRGGILNVSSGFGLETMPMFSTYVGTKHFVTGLSECVHVEAAGLGVTITQSCPGPVATEFDQVAGASGDDVPSLFRISAAHCARDSLRGFAKGRAIVVPGLVMKLMMLSGAMTPRWLKRLLNRLLAGPMRARQLPRDAAT